MTLYTEYSTLADIHTMTGSTGVTQDGYYSDLIKSVSRELEATANRRFVPVVQTQVYDVPNAGAIYPTGAGRFAAPGQVLTFDDDILEVTTLTNGDGTVIASTNWVLAPANAYPKYRLQLRNTSTVSFRPDTSGNYQQVLSLLGVFGFHLDYSFAWKQVDTLNGGITIGATSMTTTGSATVRIGDLLKIGTEFLYPSAVAGSAVTVDRAANGSTAAAHNSLDPVYRWNQPQVESVVRTAVIAYARLKDNPIGESGIDISGYRFQTPKDVNKWISSRANALGLIRIGFG